MWVVFSYCIDDCIGSDGVVFEEDVWVADASVDVGFGCYVYDSVDLINCFVQKLGVAYVATYESVSRVVFDVVDDQGRSFHGTGDKAVYTHRITPTMTNDLVELTGSPAMLAATNLVGRNQIITLDLASHRLTAPGRYKLWGTGPVPTATTFQLPKTKLTR